MSTLEERSLDKLADMVFNVLWQEPLELYTVIRKKMEIEGTEAVRSAFESARTRFFEGPFKEMISVRWGMSMCPLCNDDNIEKNGIGYVEPTGDGLEFNQCLNCRIGILYKVEMANATLENYVIGLGQSGQFGGMSFFWNGVVPDDMKKFEPLYDIVDKGQWRGKISFCDSLEPRFLPFESMVYGVSRGAEEPWTPDLPDDIRLAVESFIQIAKDQVEVSLVLK
jgi:hypothetical protein